MGMHTIIDTDVCTHIDIHSDMGMHTYRHYAHTHTWPCTDMDIHTYTETHSFSSDKESCPADKSARFFFFFFTVANAEIS